MGWLSRLRRAGPADPPPEEANEPAAPAHGPPLERAAPGLAALFAGLPEDGSRVVLDLGPAAQGHLRAFRGYARKMRFAGLLPTPPRGRGWSEAMRALPPHPQRPYDVVLAWNILDLLVEDERALLVESLARLTAAHARLYSVVDVSGQSHPQPLRFTVLDLNRVRQQPVGPPEPRGPQLLPAQVERLLMPFDVVRAFTLRQGLREYVAVKGGEAAYGRG